MKDLKELRKGYIRSRFEAESVHLREKSAEDAGGGSGRTIEGRAIVFNRPTTLWENERELVEEVIEPSCVTEEWLREQDVKLNMLHDRACTIARCNKGVGTLKMMVREDGVYFEAEAPECDLGDRALALIGNRTYSGCSFEATTGDYEAEDLGELNGKEHWLIRHKSFERMKGLTIAMDPQYEGTDVTKRETEDLTPAEKELLEKEKAEREARHLLSRVAKINRECAILEAATE